MCSAEILFVKSDAQGTSSGKSWHDAYLDLQSALGNVNTGDQVWVASGVYYPTATGNREATFSLNSGVTLLGGFKGDEKSERERDLQSNKAVLSGNIGKSKTENVKHVVTLKGRAIIDGFIIEGGFALPTQGLRPPSQGHTTPEAIVEGGQDGVGGGILMFNHAGLVKNCLIRNNEAGKGGGVYNMTRGLEENPVFINVVFENNIAHMRGGGMSNDLGTNPLIIHCSFRKNVSKAKGGALYNDFGSSPAIINCDFSENKAIRAAAIGSDGSSKPIMIGTTITKNLAQDVGAGLYQGSYNANIPGGANEMVVIESSIFNNKSLTNGPNIFVWGANVYKFYDSKVESWPWPSSVRIPDKYERFVALAEKYRQQKTIEVSARDFEIILSLIQKPSSPKKDNQPFQIQAAKVTKTLQIPDRVVFVNQAGHRATQDGKSWGTAFTNLQEAIDHTSQEGGGQIWIAQGTYFSTSQERPTASFVLQPNISLYGGFVGNETLLSQRNFQRHLTILSGHQEKMPRSFHVVIGSKNSLIDGFIIEGGGASGEGVHGYGGGLVMIGPDQSSNIANIIFRDNYAYYGGAVYAFNNVMSYLDHVTMENNSAVMGAGMYIAFGSNLEFKNGVIRNNNAKSRGGGIVVNYGANPLFENTTFSSNKSLGNGGGVWIDNQASQFGGTTPTFKHCRFDENQATYYGGAIDVFNESKAIIKDTTFQNNQARYGKDVYSTQISD